MTGNNRGWLGVVSCFVLFTLVFLSQKMRIVGTSLEDGFRGDPGMLLFLLPGMVSSYLSRNRRLHYPLMGALVAMPICLLVLQLWQFPSLSFWQELAYVSSAVFWCLMGGLVFLFLRAVSRHYFH
ncbi:inner membrane protein YbjM [Dickeya fangzhongdai]|uniref:inner membrane protein YbjM n=1 Tax=Dickeya fangzhongdai TaxID=1778540 RepID=UPI0004F84679|nr:inner membrane protein YbjM [Dickeya fangzhongdai]AIR68222.1 membrane protein [Dickeya fangzhongdai]KGT97769.1 membrane protein [Dickeya fangzhongdai]KHN56985.1 membrane protein [Dickeya fangzhongdai]WPD76337.1 inner membrane protein YbjM [Dickeya fangzhongdai]